MIIIYPHRVYVNRQKIHYACKNRLHAIYFCDIVLEEKKAERRFIDMAALKFTTDNFDEEVLKSDKPVLVDFWATWCAPCRMQGPIIEELADERSDIKVGKLDVDENPEIAEKYGVMSIPTLLVIENGEVVHQMVGVQTKQQISDFLPQA